MLITQEVPREFYAPFAALVGVPFVVLVLDYIFRWLPILETLRRAGPDFCVMGLGSSGAIFVDKRVIDTLTKLTTLPVQLNMVFVLLIIIAFRQIAFKLTEKDNKPGQVQGQEKERVNQRSLFLAVSSCAFGMASILLITSILYVSYTS